MKRRKSKQRKQEQTLGVGVWLFPAPWCAYVENWQTLRVNCWSCSWRGFVQDRWKMASTIKALFVTVCYKSPKLKATQMLDIEVIIWRYSYRGMLSQNVEGRNKTTPPELRNHSRRRLTMPSPADGEKTRAWWVVSEQDRRRTFLSDGSDLYLD